MRRPVPVLPVPLLLTPLLVALVLLAPTSCSGHRPAGTAAPATSTAPTTAADSPPPTSADTSPPGTSHGTPPGTSPRDSGSAAPEQRITELSTEGGVASVVIELSAEGTVDRPRTERIAAGQTLRLVVVSPTAAHLTGTGLGVDIDIPAGAPTAVDVVSFTPGTYTVTTGRGATILTVTVHD
jgi:hypothetical protein